MSYYQETDSHIRDKVKVVLDLSNYATKNKLDHVTGVDTSDLAAKKILFLEKLRLINQTLILVNVPTSLSNSKSKVDDFDVGRWKTVSVNLKTLSDLVATEIVKNTKLDTLKRNVSRKKNRDGTTLKKQNRL